MSSILVLDYGDENLDNLVAHIRKRGIKVQQGERSMRAKDIRADKSIKGVILAGGPYTIYADDIEVVDPELFELDVPLLGIGRGMQVMLHQLGGTVTPAGYKYAPTDSALTLKHNRKGIFNRLQSEVVRPLGFDAKVSALPEGFDVLASGKEVESGDDRPFGAVEYPAKKLYGIQFVVDTKNSQFSAKAINNFLAMCHA